VSYVGVFLILFGFGFFVLEVKVMSFGLLGVGGVILLFLGSMMFIDSLVSELQIGFRLIVLMMFDKF